MAESSEGIAVGIVTGKTPYSKEVSEVLIEDIEGALSRILKDILPFAAYKVEKFSNESGVGFTLTLLSDKYPRLVKLNSDDFKGPLQLTDQGRKVFHRPPKET